MGCSLSLPFREHWLNAARKCQAFPRGQIECALCEAVGFGGTQALVFSSCDICTFVVQRQSVVVCSTLYSNRYDAWQEYLVGF